MMILGACVFIVLCGVAGWMVERVILALEKGATALEKHCARKERSLLLYDEERTEEDKGVHVSVEEIQIHNGTRYLLTVCYWNGEKREGVERVWAEREATLKVALSEFDMWNKELWPEGESVSTRLGRRKRRNLAEAEAL